MIKENQGKNSKNGRTSKETTVTKADKGVYLVVNMATWADQAR